MTVKIKVAHYKIVFVCRVGLPRTRFLFVPILVSTHSRSLPEVNTAQVTCFNFWSCRNPSFCSAVYQFFKELTTQKFEVKAQKTYHFSFPTLCFNKPFKYVIQWHYFVERKFFLENNAMHINFVIFSHSNIPTLWVMKLY